MLGHRRHVKGDKRMAEPGELSGDKLFAYARWTLDTDRNFLWKCNADAADIGEKLYAPFAGGKELILGAPDTDRLIPHSLDGAKGVSPGSRGDRRRRWLG